MLLRESGKNAGKKEKESSRVVRSCVAHTHSRYTLQVLELVAALDSGSRAAPVSWVGRGARLLSGLPVPHQAWRRWSGPAPWLNNVVVTNVLELGLDKKFIGGFLRPDNPGGNKMGRCTSYQMELFFGGEPMTIARYPNVVDGKSQWLHVDTVLDSQHVFQVQDERLLAWRAEPDAWLHGYWSFDWADSYVRVTDVDTNATSGAVRVRVEEPVLYGFTEGAKFYGVNILSELDAPGEYYIDRQTGDLYFWPPGELEGTEVFLSVGDYTVVLGTTAAVVREAALAAEEPGPAATQSLAALREHAGAAFAMRAEMLQDASAFRHDLDEQMLGDASDAPRAKTPASVWLGDFDFWNGRRVAQRREMASAAASRGQARLERVALQNFGIHYARVSGVVVAAARNVQLQDLIVSNVGQVGVDMDGEYLHVNRVEVAHTGCGAMSLNGGDSFCLGSDPEYCREQGSTLRRSQNVVEHSVLHNFARLCRTYTPGLAFTGCGHTFRHNVVRDAPHSGVIGAGNDCVFADNSFRHLAFEATDSGALMMGRSWVRRGHQIVRNRFEHIKNTQGMVLGYAQVCVPLRCPACVNSRAGTGAWGRCRGGALAPLHLPTWHLPPSHLPHTHMSHHHCICLFAPASLRLPLRRLTSAG